MEINTVKNENQSKKTGRKQIKLSRSEVMVTQTTV